MSITFYCPTSPRTNRVEDGITWTEQPHECNFANGNALDLLQMIGLLNSENPWTGCWKSEDLPTVQRSIMRALNMDGHRVHLVREPHINKEPGRATAIYQGNTDTQTIRRLIQLQELVAYASENNYSIVYN